MNSNEAMPCRGRSEDTTEALCQHRQSSRGDVAVLRRGDHLADLTALPRCEPLRRVVRTRGLVLEFALACRVSPGAEARWTQADRAEDPMDAPNPTGAFNGVEEAALAIGVDPHVGQVGAQNTQQREHDPQRAGKPRYSCLQLGDSDVKRCDRFVQAGCRRDCWERPSKPARRRRAWNADPGRDRSITGVPDETQETVVVASLGSFGGHPDIVSAIAGRGAVRSGDPLPRAGNSNQNAGMS